MVSLCRGYQRLFRASHAEEAALVALHGGGDREAFLRAYYEHERAKGDLIVERFRDHVPATPSGTALDFGCGAGGLAQAIAKRYATTHGIDIEFDKLRFGQARLRETGQGRVLLTYYQGSRLPYRTGTFDAIFCIDVAEHLPDLPSFVAEFERVLRPGGKLLLSFGPPWGHAHGKHMWEKLPGWWTHLLFPTAVVMDVRGFPPGTTWEAVGIHRLTLARFRRVMRACGLRQEALRYRVNRWVAWTRHVPLLRELFVAEVEAVYSKPA